MSRDAKTPPEVESTQSTAADGAEAPEADATPLQILEREFKKFWTSLDGQPGPTEAAVNAKSDLEARIKDAPWATMGLIAVVGLIIGFLLGSRRSN